MKPQKTFYTSLLVSSFLFAFSNPTVAKAQGLDSLTSEQRTCLESKLGKPGESERPSREKAEAAFLACKVDTSKLEHGPRDRRGPPPGFENLTDTQKSCLKANLGEPGSGERPSREKMDAAIAKCKIQISDLGGPGENSNQGSQYRQQQKQKSSVNQ